MTLCLACACAAAWGQDALALSCEGRASIPGVNDYKIELYTYPDGLISRALHYTGPATRPDLSVSVVNNNNGEVRGIIEDTGIRERFSLSERGKDLVVELESKDSAGATKSVKRNILLLPGGGALFEDESGRFFITEDREFCFADKASGRYIHKSIKNELLFDRRYKAEFRRQGDNTEATVYSKTGKAGELLSSGSLLISGKLPPVATVDVRIKNYIILRQAFDNPLLIPFVFGLDTGSY
jgi:hypothetical protein